MESTDRTSGANSPQYDQHASELSQGKHSTTQRETKDALALPAESLREYDWEQLQNSYANAMDEHGRSEEELRAQVSKLLEIFVAWSQTTVVRDEVRALKRFKTQMQHVQNSEETLEKKRKHYVDVVKAFESALALLNERIKT